MIAENCKRGEEVYDLFFPPPSFFFSFDTKDVHDMQEQKARLKGSVGLATIGC